MKATLKKATSRTRVRPRARSPHSADKYTYRVQWSAEDGVHIADCLEFPTLLAHGPTPADALREIGIVVGETLAWMAEDNEPIPVPMGLRRIKPNPALRIPARLRPLAAI